MIILVSGSINGQSVTMLQNSMNNPKEQATMITNFFFSQRLVQMLSPPIFSLVANQLGAFDDPTVYGKMLAATVLTSYSIAIPLFIMGGKSYNEEMS